MPDSAGAKEPGSHALIVVDVQCDFCAGGAAAISDDDSFLAEINALIRRFDTVILTQAWHKSSHLSFAPAGRPGSAAPVFSGGRLLWPPHCLAGTKGAEFHPDLITNTARLLLRRGLERNDDSLSVFFAAGGRPRGLAGFLREAGCESLTFCGLATDFGVGISALDAARLGFKARIALAAAQALDIDGSYDRRLRALRQAGVELGLFA